MSRLTDRIRGGPGGGVRETFMGPEPWGDGLPAGYVIDGVPYPLDGQPPTAKLGNWGNIGWLMLPTSGPLYGIGRLRE